MKEELENRILNLARELDALKFGTFTLASGATSKYYFDGRLLTLSPEGSYLVARALLPILRHHKAEAVGGPTLAADPIVAAITMLSFQEKGIALPGFIVRKENKEHGTGRLIEGPLLPGQRVAIVDDTCSTGGSLRHAVNAAEELGCKVVIVATVLDRHMGGSEGFIKDGYLFHALLEADSEGNITPVNGGPAIR